MATPISPSTNKVRQASLMLSLKPSNDQEFPISYADNNWDIAAAVSSLARLTGATGTYDQHSLNELFASLLLSLLPQPSTHNDFTEDFNNDFY